MVTTSSVQNSVPKCGMSKCYRFFKRVFDVILAAFALILLSPLFLVLGIAVKATSEGEVIYSHQRVGRYGKPIKVYKFRTMVKDADKLIERFSDEQRAEFEKSFKLADDPRVTKVGKFLRRTSLDELPQLLNILKGDMSVVGPRPITQKETEFFGSDRGLLLSVKPGLTGFWAANGRSNTTYEQRIKLELYYVRRCSLWLDIKIILKTVVSVFKGDGAH